jgi:glycosyltransferase involved in cell wall biosynthesis
MEVRKVLFVIPNLGHDSRTAQLVQLVEALPREQFSCRVCVLGRAGILAERLRESGIEVDAPGRGRLLDLRPWIHLRRLVREFAPDVLHTWGLSTLRARAVSGFKGRLVACPCPQPHAKRFWLRWLDRRVLRRADHVVAFGETEAARCRELGLDASKIAIVSPAVRLEDRPATTSPVPEGTRFILCIGRLEMDKGFHEAIWVHDMLRYVHADLHLVIAGEGPDRERLARFAANAGSAPVVHFLGEVADVFPLLKRAELVWSPGRAETGTQVVLEAMAAGKPVVASRFPRLAELIVEGETGFLVPAEDKPLLGRQTQLLLNDAGIRQRFGEAGRRRVVEHYPPHRLAEQCTLLYKGL